ncbi:MAG: hypothetical protein F9K30_21115 [Dechloromonas sp.]|nr:MAG: hypothetical protein F9K30_21115 [Dechloromonas sp.]
MEYFPVLLAFIALLALPVFFWNQVGPGSGHRLGNRIAAHIGIPRNVFYALLTNGVKGSSRELLRSLEKSKLSLDEASVKLGPTLNRGIERLEGRFGAQEMYDKAKPIVARLVAESERKSGESDHP